MTIKNNSIKIVQNNVIPIKLSPFQKLDSDLLFEIIPYINPAEIIKLSASCRSIKSYISSIQPEFVKKINSGCELTGLKLQKTGNFLQYALNDFVKSSDASVIHKKYRLDSIPALLSREMDSQYRQIAAGHSNCPKHILRRLAQDPDPKVRKALACNHATPKSVLKLLAKDSDPDVKKTFFVIILHQRF